MFVNSQSDILDMLPGMDFIIVHKKDDYPNNIEFKLHNHDDIYEIVLFLNGDCEFIVEGNAYKLKSGDIAFTRPFEFHNIRCLTEKTYERVILYIKEDFFVNHSCEQFLDIFKNRELGIGNVSSYDLPNNDAVDCIFRILKYYSQKAYRVAQAAVTEFLYLINNTKAFDEYLCHNSRIRDIIMFINNNLTKKLKLDDIAEKFYIDKHYLCKSFKKNTGYTVNQYINYKRILLAQNLHKNGQSLLQASFNAGFNSYAHFYKTYVKQTGKSPKFM